MAEVVKWCFMSCSLKNPKMSETGHVIWSLVGKVYSTNTDLTGPLLFGWFDLTRGTDNGTSQCRVMALYCTVL